MSIRYQGVTVGGLTEVDGELSSSSTNPVQNKVVTGALALKADLVNGTVPAAQLPAMDYVPTSRTVNGKALSTDITLTASDVGALPSPVVLTTAGDAPTTSTVGTPGCRAVNTADGKAWTCTAVTNTGTEAEPVWSYTWTDDINAKGGTFKAPVGIGNIVQRPNQTALVIGYGIKAQAAVDSIIVGSWTTKTECTYSLLLGEAPTAVGQVQNVFFAGKYNISRNAPIVVGGGSSNERSNILDLDWNGNLCTSGGIQQFLKTIPSATTAYTLAEGSQSHSPTAASTYTLPDIPYYIIVNNSYWERYPTADGTGYYAWIIYNINNRIYTASATPSVGDNTYTNTALTQGAKAITAIDNRTHEITLDVEFAAYARYTDGDSGSAYAWKHNSDILYTDTTSITAGTTKAYTDTALTTEAGTIALYDSTANAFAMCGSVAFENADGDTVEPMEDIDIKPGTVVCYLCRWNSILQCWVIMPTPQENRTVLRPVITISPSSYTVNGNQNSAIASLALGANTTVANPTSGSLSFSSSDLPAGISISSAGVISGTPTATGTTTSTVTIAYPNATSITCTVTFIIAAPAVTYYYTVSGAPNLNKINLDSDVEATDVSVNGDYSLYSGTHGTSSAVYTNGTIYMQLDPREGGGWNLLLEPVSDWGGEMGPNFVGFYMGGTGTTPDTGTWNASNGTPFMPGSADWMYAAASGSTATVSAYSA